MIQGTASSVGKSMICTGLLRIFQQDGYKVYPFKSQNMSNKYTLTEDGFKISTAQNLQAIAARVNPNPRMNPILLIPNSESGSRVVINGMDKIDLEAAEYFKYKKDLRKMVYEIFKEIESENDLIVIEGAGSPAEINLNEDDFVNMGLAQMTNSPVLLVADIDRGGVFASIYGTVMLLDESQRKRIKGILINKFRGDITLLQPGLKMIEELVNIPVIGVVPYTHLELEDEDSLTEYDKLCNVVKQNTEDIDSEIDRLAQILRDNIDLNYIYEILGIKNA
ncbi:cobyric acid synthase [Soehngenia longivitae]|uniref:Cobyric acid synthase n=2 Tax=Soehngenia longivitae TaxID=2562294 RepID=A0A4Z0DAH0_9FIRM|nr:cobyric acid synthase [Soehngenia longivitae]